MLRFDTCSGLHTESNWNIVKILHKMQRFIWDFGNFQKNSAVWVGFRQKGLGFRALRRRRRLTSNLFGDFQNYLFIFVRTFKFVRVEFVNLFVNFI